MEDRRRDEEGEGGTNEVEGEEEGEENREVNRTNSQKVIELKKKE